ncbi:MAG TPA: MutH/Sau3AI family endonuclease, partial [Polyangiaceae bacterium]
PSPPSLRALRDPPSPPRDADELVGRARALDGVSIDELARLSGVRVDGAPVSTKGKMGELLERVLGATGGSVATWDFPELAIELKTIPVDARGVPSESTFVCAVSLLDAERAEWETSWARAKLSRVLWVPVTGDVGSERRVGSARLWSPSAEQEGILQGDFEEIFGRIAASGIEDISARVGRWLQLRPKAAHGGVRTRAPGGDEGDVATVPRGFYLRARFTGAILRDPLALPA